LNKISAEKNLVPFEIDQISINVLMKSEESVERELRVTNVGNDESYVIIEVMGLSDIVSVIDKEFTIKPGQTKIVRLNFLSFSEVKGIKPGVYIGKVTAKTDYYETEVPLIVEIKSKNVFFDMNLNPIARDRKINRGESTTFEIKIFNLLDLESYNVGMKYFVKDINGNTIISEKENVVVKAQASFFKTLKIPENLKLGNYVFVVQSSFGNSIGTASYLFNVESVVKENIFTNFIWFCRNDPLCWAWSIVVLLFIFTIGTYAYFFVGTYIHNKVVSLKIQKIRRLRPKQEFELEKEEFKLKKEGEKIKFKEDEKLREEILGGKRKLKEIKLHEKEKVLKKFRYIIGYGHRALDKNNLKKAEKIYSELMDRYEGLPSRIKTGIFKEINSFYKAILEKYKILKRKADEEKYAIEKLNEEKKLEKKRKIQEKERKREEKRKRGEEKKKQKELELKKKEKPGLFRRDEKKEGEKKKLREEKVKQRELELRKREREKKGRKHKELEFKRVGEEERRKRELETRKEKELEIKTREEQLKIRNEIKKKRESNSGKFTKCHDLLLRSEHALDRNLMDESRKFYIKARDVYTKLEYIEKKEIYEDLMKIYRKLKNNN